MSDPGEDLIKAMDMTNFSVTKRIEEPKKLAEQAALNAAAMQSKKEELEKVNAAVQFTSKLNSEKEKTAAEKKKEDDAKKKGTLLRKIRKYLGNPVFSKKLKAANLGPQPTTKDTLETVSNYYADIQMHIGSDGAQFQLNMYAAAVFHGFERLFVDVYPLPGYDVEGFADYMTEKQKNTGESRYESVFREENEQLKIDYEEWFSSSVWTRIGLKLHESAKLYSDKKIQIQQDLDGPNYKNL